jgi:hypothetical protein
MLELGAIALGITVVVLILGGIGLFVPSRSGKSYSGSSRSGPRHSGAPPPVAPPSGAPPKGRTETTATRGMRAHQTKAERKAMIRSWDKR